MKNGKNVLLVRLFGFAAIIAAVTIGFTALSLTGCGGGGGGGGGGGDPKVISIKAIAGITAPKTGEIPKGTITPTAQYTGTISWKDSRDNSSVATFAAKTAYTAIITLKPESGYTLKGVTANFFTVAGATSATNDADSGVITAVFPSTPGTEDDPAEIDLKAISGVTAPVTGATPVTAITPTDQYTGTVAWNGNPVTFAASTVYTATITLTAKTGYTLEGVTENFFTVAGATSATYDADTGVITAVFPATAAAVYGVSLSADMDTFDAATVGYHSVNPLIVTVTNTGDQATGDLSVALSGTNAANFNLSTTSIDSIAVNRTDEFEVCPVTGLAAGTYAVTVTVSGGNGINVSVDFSFTVKVQMATNTIEYYWVDKHDNLATTSGGETSIASGASLTITAQGAGYTIKSWYVNGVDTGLSGNTYVFSSTKTGKHSVGLIVEKGGKSYNTNIIITVQE